MTLDHSPAPTENVYQFVTDTYDTAMIASSLPEMASSLVIGSHATTKWLIDKGRYQIEVWKQVHSAERLVQEITTDNDRLSIILRRRDPQPACYSFKLDVHEGVVAIGNHEDHSAGSPAAPATLALLGIKKYIDLVPTIKDVVQDESVYWESERIAYITTHDTSHLQVPPIQIIAEETVTSNQREPVRHLTYEDARRRLNAKFSGEGCTPLLYSYDYSVVNSTPPYGELTNDLLSMMIDYSTTTVDALTTLLAKRWKS